MTTLGGRVPFVALGWALAAALVACGSPGGVQASATLPEAGSVTTDATASTTAAPPATTAPLFTPLPAPTALVVPPPPPPPPTAPPSTAIASPSGSATATVNAAPEGTERPTSAPAASAPPMPASTDRPAPAPAGPTPAPAGPTPAPTTSSNGRAVLIANGSEVYTLNCADCHGENGLGSFQYSGIWGVGSRYSTAGLTAELTTGHPFTFGFADKLSADEIASVVAYVLATF